MGLSLLLTACGEDSTQKVQQNPQEKTAKIKLVEKSIPKEYTFTFSDLNNQASKLYIKENIYNFVNIQQPIVLVTFFSTWCPPCRGQIPHLSNLQEIFKENVFIVGALVYDDLNHKELAKFFVSQKAHFFISSNQKENLDFAHMLAPNLRLKPNFEIPMTVMFVNGKYYTHYEQAIPEEMLASDITQALKKIQP